MFFILGFFSNAKTNLAFIFSQEITSESNKNTFGTLVNICDGGSLIVNALYFKFVSK